MYGKYQVGTSRIVKMILATRILLLLTVTTTMCLAAPGQDRALELRSEDQQIPPSTDDDADVGQPTTADSGSRMHMLLSKGLTPLQRVSTGALGFICSAIAPATAASNFFQSYVLGVLTWILGWATTVTTFLPPVSLPLNGVQVGLNMGRSVLSTVTYVASNYGCTVTNGLTGAINFVVNTLTRII